MTRYEVVRVDQCPECGGRGSGEEHSSPFGDVRFFVCQFCHGTGERRETVATLPADVREMLEDAIRLSGPEGYIEFSANAIMREIGIGEEQK